MEYLFRDDGPAADDRYGGGEDPRLHGVEVVGRRPNEDAAVGEAFMRLFGEERRYDQTYGIAVCGGARRDYDLVECVELCGKPGLRMFSLDEIVQGRAGDVTRATGEAPARRPGLSTQPVPVPECR